MKKIEVQMFAVMTDYFDRELTVETEGNVAAVVDALISRNPHAADVLKDCRFAVNENFVDLNYELNDGEKIFIIPPSSGG